MKIVYNAYGQSTEIDNTDIKIIKLIISNGTYKISEVLNNTDLKKGYFITQYYDEDSKDSLNNLFKNIPDAKERIYRLMINGLIEKEYHDYKNNLFRLRIYSRIFQVHEIKEDDKSKEKKVLLDIKEEIRYKKNKDVNKIDPTTIIKEPKDSYYAKPIPDEYTLKLIRKSYIKKGIPIKRFNAIYGE